MKKKILIIGGGISGLIAGVYAAKEGFHAELFEQRQIIGGECTGWDRSGYHIDNSIHWISGTKPGSELYKIWQTAGALSDHIHTINTDPMFTTEYKGQSISFWKDISRTERELIELSPEDEENIHKLMTYCRMSRYIQIPAAKPAELMTRLDKIKENSSTKKAISLFNQLKGLTTGDLADKFKHPLIRYAISDTCTRESTASSFPFAYGNFISGNAGIPQGGSRAMALRIRMKFEKLGGIVHTGQSIKKIILKNDHATGIELENGRIIHSDYIICACGASVTFGKLLPIEYMPETLRKIREEVEAYPVYNTFQAAFAVNSPKDIINGKHIFDTPDLIFAPGVSDRVIVKSYGAQHDFAPIGKQVIQLMLGGSDEVFDYWKGLYDDKDAYTAKKRELAKRAISVLEEHFPEYKNKISMLDTWTPMTYIRYFGSFKGYYQSFMLTLNHPDMGNPVALPEKIDNIMLAGQWLNVPGGLPGSAVSGKFAIQRILKKEGRKIVI